MPKEIQNKIDEEFDNNQILNNLALFEIEEIKDFLHSKLQEAYELGKRDERERNIEVIESRIKVLRNLLRGNPDDRAGELEDILDKLKSLQTNKE